MKSYPLKGLVLLFFTGSVTLLVLYRSGYFESEEKPEPENPQTNEEPIQLPDTIHPEQIIPDTIIVKSEAEKKEREEQDFQLMMTSKSLAPPYPTKVYKVVPEEKKGKPATAPASKKSDPELIIIPSSKSGPVFTPIQQEEEK